MHERVKPGGKGGELWRRLRRDSEGWASEEKDAALMLLRRISRSNSIFERYA